MFLSRMFPNGIGIRGLIALILVCAIVIVANRTNDLSLVRELAVVAVMWFFAKRDDAARAVKGQ